MFKNNLLKNKRGSAALISTLIVMLVLMATVISTSDIQIAGSDQQVNNEASIESGYIAEACIEEVINRLENNNGYSGGTLTFPGISIQCTVSISGTTTKDIDVTVSNGDYEQHYSASATFTQNGEIYNAELLTWTRT